jgi:hypothetical protein
MVSLSRRRLLAASATILAAPPASRAQSQTGAWPARQIRMIAPYPPGGGVSAPPASAPQPRLIQLTSAFGPALFGLLRDSFGGYVWPGDRVAETALGGFSSFIDRGPFGPI